jgi:hypothetical protein
MFIQNIRSYAPYLEAVSSMRNFRTCHAMVVGSREGVGWIEPAQDMDKWLHRVKVVTKIQVP